jgi:peptidoglycan/LPS O-acetylase OafA/YrhL
LSLSISDVLHAGKDIPFLSTGFLGVDLFFILSGAVMYHVHAFDFKTYKPSTHLKFLKLRLARIYPLHVFCLLAFAIAVWVLPDFTDGYREGTFSLTSFIQTLALVNNWGFSYSTMWNGPTWSLSAEWLGYLFFPAIVILINWTIPPRWSSATALVLLALLIVAMRHLGAQTIGEMGKPGILRMACEFSSGCLLYRAAIGIRRNTMPVFWVGIIITLICAYSLTLSWGAVFGLALLIFSLSTESGLKDRVFSNKLAVWLGNISFSLYLSHWPMIQVSQWVMRAYRIDGRFIYVAVSMLFPVLAHLLYKFVEIPSRDYLRTRMRSARSSTKTTVV